MALVKRKRNGVDAVESELSESRLVSAGEASFLSLLLKQSSTPLAKTEDWKIKQTSHGFGPRPKRVGDGGAREE